MKWIPDFFRFRRVNVRNNTSDARSLSSTFSEHTWDLYKTIENYPCSRIFAGDPFRSVGLGQQDVKRLLEVRFILFLSLIGTLNRRPLAFFPSSLQDHFQSS